MNKEQILKLLNHYEQSSDCRKRQVAAFIVPHGLLKHDWVTIDRKDLIIGAANKCVLPNINTYYCSSCDECMKGSTKITCPAIHAEAACLSKASFDEVTSNTLFVSYSPCPDCCKLILAAGISRVVIKEPRTKSPSVADCIFYNVNSYDELAKKLLYNVEYVRLWEQDDDWQVS